ncbi:MAG: Rne/Rng family ribonuclease [Terriglobales bacterium]
MIREMYVSSTPHETKVALVEDDQLAEIFFERENEYTLAGSIYKGRVTRVLPGMQSAFVDIGLERDAFLYVSDFLELPEDEESEFEAIAVSRPETFVTNRPPQEPHFEFRPEPPRAPAVSGAEAEGVAETEAEEEVAEGNTQEFAEAQSPAEAAQYDPGRFRNRRRRGRRGRGFPESKFVRHDDYERGPTPPETGPSAGHQPVVLPGESLSKYQPRETAAQAQAPSGEPPQVETREERRPRYEREEPQEPSAPSPIVLPGESIAKYQPRAGQPESEARVETSLERPERWRETRPSREPRESYVPQGQRITVLPGESLAKYQARTEQKAREQAQHAAESEERMSQEAATFVIESEPWSETLARDVEQRPSGPQETHVPPQQDILAVSPPAETEPSAEEREKYEQMNVAAVFGGEAAEKEEGPHDSQPMAAEEGAAPSASAGSVTAEPEQFEPAAPAAPAVETTDHTNVPGGAREHMFGHAGEGTLEHEEIDGEETELHPPSEEESDSDFVELEEETLEAGSFRPVAADEPPPGGNGQVIEGEELTEAAEQSDVEAAALAESYATEEEFGEDEDTEFEEEELVGEEELNGYPEEQQEAAISRAEVRAPNGTAGYQRTQRVPFDRRRGRRGGRRPMRRPGQAPHPRHNVQISDLLKEGQEVLIQIAKEPIGKKGARITSHIALPGRFLVYMPTVNHIGVSRKITSDEERQRLKRIMLSEREGGHGGFIVRTAAAGVGEDELRADIRFLKNLWAQIKNRADNSKAPALIYHDLNLVERILRDLVTSDFAHIWVDTEQEYERIVNFANRFQPSLVRRVKLYTKETPLFEQFGIQEEINKALKAKVWLKSGGYIVINQTEALVAIDINTGKYVGKTARLEDTIVKTNVDAIKEIVRQIRLRDLGGIIVIDFIDMDERKNRQKVMQALEEALQADRSPSKVLAFNDFGLVAITRKRVKQSLERTLGSLCPYCTGNGFVKSVTTVCNDIYTELRKTARHFEDDVITLRVNPEVAKAIKANNARWLSDYEEVTGRTVLVKSDALLHQEQFDIH